MLTWLTTFQSVVERSSSKTRSTTENTPKGVFSFIDEQGEVGYSRSTMKGRTRLLFIVLGIVVITLIGWQWSRDTETVSTRSYPGFVNEVEIDIPEEILAQWEVGLRTELAVLEQNPEDLAALQSVAVLNKSMGNLGVARRYMERYMELNAINPTAWVILGDITWDMEDYETAEASYVKALTLATDENVFFKLERLWREQFPERYNDIETLYEDAIRLDRQRPSYLTQLARWYAEQERWQEAAANMEVVVQLLPDNEGARADLATYRENARNQ